MIYRFPALFGGVGRPDLDLNFAAAKALDPRITFTRGSSGSYIGADGLVKTAATNEPRFDHDPLTGLCRGLLIEESRTNLMPRSEEFDNAYWTKTASAVATGSISPAGAATAFKLTTDTTSAEHSVVSQLIAAVSGTVYTSSIWAKAGEKSLLFINFHTPGFTAPTPSYFDLATGVATAGAGVTVGMQSYPGGWYRCIASKTATASNSGGFRYGLCDSTATTQSTGANTTDGLYLWGAQIEAGAFATSYIPTTSAAATRAADVCTITGADFARWYRQEEGAFIWEGYRQVAATSASAAGVPRWFDASAGTSTSTIAAFTRAADGTAPGESFLVNDAGSLFEAVLGSPAAVGSLMRMGAAYRVNDFAAARGALTAIDTFGTVPAPTRLDIGNRYDGIRPLNGTIARLRYWRRRLPDSQLRILTQL